MLDNLTETIQLSKLVEWLICPVCLQFSSDNSYLQCWNGHSGCKSCFSRLSSCPVCRTKKSNIIETISAEKMSEILRELRHVENYNCTLNGKDILKFFQCTTCGLFPTCPLVYKCKKGHVVCYECYETMKCLKCKCFAFYPTIRCLLTENVLSEFPKICRFSKYGCTETVTSLNRHEKYDCYFREVQCIFNIVRKIPINNYLQHLEDPDEEHRRLEVKNQPGEMIRGSFDLSGQNDFFRMSVSVYFKVSHIQLHPNKHFLAVGWANGILQKSFFWVYYIGQPKEAKHYSFQMKLYQPDGKKEIKIDGAVILIDVRKHAAKESPNAFSMTFKAIKSYWNINSIAVSWEVTVFEKEPINISKLVISRT
jgi:hypothetical protein